MGDGLKLPKDKRHRSSSSIAGAGLEGTRSERKLDIRALIPEDDHFALAETRCDNLQEKIDLVKVLKRKKKFNKRSVTRMSEQATGIENVPLITVRTQPKRKVTQQAARLRRLELPQNPTRGYLDPATVEQHRMLGQVWGYGQNYGQGQPNQTQKQYAKTQPRRTHADGDGSCGQSVPTTEAGRQDYCDEFSDTELFDQKPQALVDVDGRGQSKAIATRRRNYSTRDNTLKEVPKWIDSGMENIRAPRTRVVSPNPRRQKQQQQPQQQQQQQQNIAPRQPEDRPVVELFNKSRPGVPAPGQLQAPQPQEISKKEEKRAKKSRDALKYVQAKAEEEVIPAESKKEIHHPRRLKYRSHNYEMPTVASQMKQTDIRYHYGTCNRSKIPFVVSKSTAPSHNIGVNIQQVLNGLKIQQPLNGIPLTIAHHMGLGHVPTYGTKSVTTQPSLDNREINAIKLGQRLLMLPSYKYMSYNRLLSLYREGDGMVPRFLRAISRPNYFYTSMYNLATNREDLDGATSKGRGGGGGGNGGGGGGQETKQQLAEYANLYREYEQVDRRAKEGRAPDLERRRDELLHELAAREDHIRKLVQESTTVGAPGEFNLNNLRASASVAEDGYRHSTFKLNAGDPPH